MELVSQAEAARIAEKETGGKCSRQAIGDIKKKGTYSFFNGKKVDIDSPDWKAYLSNRENNSGGVKKVDKKQISKKVKKPVTPPVIKLVVKNVPRGTSDESSKKKPVSKSQKKEKSTERQKHALTGGVDPSSMIPTTPSQLKSLTDIQEKNINMRVKLSELVEAEMVVSVMEVVVRDIKNFVNIGRKTSGLICQKLDCVGMEKTVEAIIDPVVQSIIKMLKKNMEKSIDIKSYKG